MLTTVELDEAETSKLKEKAAYHMVVAMLVATVTFAAALRLPGGYIQTRSGKAEGMSVFAVQPRVHIPFLFFLLTNTLAFFTALSAVLILMIFTFPTWPIKHLRRALYCSHVLTIIAMGAIFVAFISAIGVVLPPDHPISHLIHIFLFIFLMSPFFFSVLIAVWKLQS